MSKLGKPAQVKSSQPADDGHVHALEARVAELNSQLEQARNELAETQQALAQAQAHEKSHVQQQQTVEVSSENLHSVPILGYWDIRGLGAQCRALLHFCGVNFTDRRYAQHFDEASMQWDKSDWLNEKFNLGMEYPNLPYLFDEDVKLTETLAIMKYVAKKWRPELLGRNAAEVGRINMLEYHVFTLKAGVTMPCYGEHPDAAAILEAIKPQLAKLYEVTGGSTFIAGENITYLDFMYHELLDVLSWMSCGSILEDFPNLKDYCDRMVALYKPEYWQENTQLRVNGPSAKLNNF